jgi:predicted ATPase
MSGKILHLPQRITTSTSERPVAPLVGRDTELAALHQRLALALQGQRQIVFIAGEPGIGKTALVDAFLRQLQERLDVHTTSGQCVEQYGPGEAYLPLLEATTRLCHAPGGEQRIEMLQRYAPSWLVQLPSLLEPPEFARLQQRVQGASRERMLREMAETAELFTARRGLVVVLEDLHWSDVSTLDWLTYIARRREPARLLILGTYRPADVLAAHHPLRGLVQELQARGQCEELRLAPLAEAAIAAYLAVRLHADGEARRGVPPHLIPLLHHRTGGNPLFLVNMVEDLIRQGALGEAVGQPPLRADAEKAISESIPDTLRQLVERQLERLPEAERRLLEVASVAGVEFAAAEAAAGLLGEQDPIEASCERLARTGQWVRATAVAEWPDGTISGRYSFRHAVYREVVYGQVAEVRRVQIHRRIAERKEAAYGERVGEIAAELATHSERGRDLTRAIQYLGKAGETAIRRNAHREAIAHLTKGLDLLMTFPETPERAQRELALLITLGVSLMATKGYAAPEVAQAYARARALSQQIGETPQLFPVLGGLFAFYLVRGEFATARTLSEQCLRIADHVGDPALAVEAHRMVSNVSYFLGDFAKGLVHAEQALALYDPQRHSGLAFMAGQDPWVVCQSFTAWHLWSLGYPDQARQRSQEAIAGAQRLVHANSLALALNFGVGLYCRCGDWGTAQELAEMAVHLAQEYGLPFWQALSNSNLGWAQIGQGLLEEGLRRVEQGLAASQATGAEAGQAGTYYLLVEAYSALGQLEAGEEAIEHGMSLIKKNDEHAWEAELYRAKGELTIQQDNQKAKRETDPRFLTPDPQGEAEAYFLKAVDISRQQQARSLELRAVMSLSRLWLRQGKRDEARNLLQEIYDWFTEGFDTKDLQEAAALLTALGGTVRRTADRRPQTGENRKQGPVNREQAEGAEQEVEREPAILKIQGSKFQVQGPQSPPNLQPPIPDAQPSVASLQDVALFHCEGEYWTLSFAGITCRLKEARGLHYIAHLLQHPHQDFHVLTLTHVRAGLSKETAEAHPLQDPGLPLDHTKERRDASAVLDPQVRAAYKQRLAELREELAEAQAFHDLGRSERLTVEIESLAQELTRAFGLNRRARQVGEPAERARVNITRAIKAALRKISEHHPALGQHLATTIKTGAYCSYTPDVRMPITWRG